MRGEWNIRWICECVMRDGFDVMGYELFKSVELLPYAEFSAKDPQDDMMTGNW